MYLQTMRLLHYHHTAMVPLCVYGVLRVSESEPVAAVLPSTLAGP